MIFALVKFPRRQVNYRNVCRIYYVERGKNLVILLTGGDKHSQMRDIEKAIDLAKEL